MRCWCGGVSRNGLAFLCTGCLLWLCHGWVLLGFKKHVRGLLMSFDTKGNAPVAIRVNALHKCFQIYATPGQRLRQFVLPRVRRWLGLDAANYYREFWALRDVSFEIKKGQTVGIIGRNGSGKSTLLRHIRDVLGDFKTRGSRLSNKCVSIHS